MTASTRPSLLFFLRFPKPAMPDRKPPSPPSASAPPPMEHYASGSNLYPQRRLTRSRKLRHVSDDELGFHPSCAERSLSPDSPLKSRSDHCSSSAAVPHPLPLPELWLRRNTTNSGSPVAAEMSCSAMARKDSDHGIITWAKSPRNCGRRVFQNSNSEAASYNLRLEVPVRSAPSSPFVSPRASETINLLPSQPHPAKRAYSHDVDAKGIHYNRGLNASASTDLKHGFSAPVSPQRTDAGDLFIPTFTGFPVWNKRNRIPRGNSKSLNASPLHPSFLRRSNMEWLHAHPLPLPPGALVPPPSSPPVSPKLTISHHSMEKTDASPMKNQWKKGKLIGRGTFGSVYVGSNRETGALCAMKEVDLAPDEPKAAECIRQLEQEIKVLGHLKHPNIVQYYGSEIVDDHFYIYLEYVYPGSINKYVHVGDMTESVVRNFTRHILSGLAYLHSTKTVHRDIKGANLLVNATGVVKLADFGLAKILTGQASLLSLKGSPHWMAPEIMQGTVPKNANPDIAFAIDIWSLGCTIIEMVTGKPPWSEYEGPAAMFKVLHRSPPIPETLSKEGKDFLQHCFRRNPAERPSASKLLEHPFVQCLHDQNTSAGSNLMDRTFSPRGTRIMNGSPQRDGGTHLSREWRAETFEHITATHQPPSMVESLLPCPVQLNCLLRNLSPSSQPSRHTHFGAVNNHPCSPSRTHGREVSHR